MSEIVKLNLSQGVLHTTLVDGKPHVILRPAIEELGLSYPRQYRKLKERSWAAVAQTATAGSDGKIYQMDVVPPRTFLMLLATINENRVAENARPALVAFQNETADAIEAYWTRGQATSMRSIEAPTTISWEQAAAIARLEYGFMIDAAELRDLLTKGDILTLTGRPRRQWEKLFHPFSTRWEIRESVLPQLIKFAAKVRRELIAAEEDLQMSLPMPISSLVREIDRSE